MKLDPNAVSENDFPVLPEGEYDFEVENTTHQTSSKGNLQWKVQFRIDPMDGPSIKVWDYFPELENMMWKFNQFFKAIGKEGIDDTDEMKDVIGEIGKCRLTIEPAKDGHPAKNKVGKYLAPAKGTAAPKKQEWSKGIEVNPDDLPF